ncbi:MAG: glutamate---cysteine ligase / carboxylate-amine ligase [Solirubrobacteraceae bacterium]|nr:glutamate---cysteine ligase / carboxylate-amine ligase [Solirubrobacteraceae bacterium]
MRAELSPSPVAEWADWNPSTPYSVGIEEEVMLIDPGDWSLAQRIDDVLPRLSQELASRATAETHGAALELASRPHDRAEDAAREIARLRLALAQELAGSGLRVASAGTHPFAMWTATEISGGARYQLVYEAMRELARREPTFALHVHVGVSDPEDAIVLYNRLRSHLPLLLALSVNSPFWQGRDTGLASARTPLFQAFPRVGIPRAFQSYDDYVESVDLLLRCEAIPEPTFLWWDVRPQPRFGTVEVRIMDAQITASETAALAALVQSVARLELEDGYHVEPHPPEIIDENRFLAARDGMAARLIDPVTERRVPAREALARLLEAARPHAADLGAENMLEMLVMLGDEPGAKRQRRVAREVGHLPGLVELLTNAFVS